MSLIQQPGTFQYKTKRRRGEMTGSRISKEDWWSGLVRKARQNYSGRESVEVSLCSHTLWAQNSTKHFQNAVFWRVFWLIGGGKVSVLIRSCSWRCCSSKLYRTYSFLVLMANSFPFAFCRCTHWPTPYKHPAAVETANQPWMTLAVRLPTHKHTPLCIHYGFWGKLK